MTETDGVLSADERAVLADAALLDIHADDHIVADLAEKVEQMFVARLAAGRGAGAARPDTAAVLAEHETRVAVMGGWSAKHGPDSDRRYGWSCRCGERDPEPHVKFWTREEVDAQRFAHVAQALADARPVEGGAAKVLAEGVHDDRRD